MTPPGSEAAAPRRVLHVLNAAVGGAAESTVALVEGLRELGVESAAVCHVVGDADTTRLRAAVDGRLLTTRLWWWNRRIRTPWWKRPLLDLRESLYTGRGHRSAAAVERFAREQQVDLVHTNTILTPEGAFAARRLGLPHVWHLRELVGPGAPFRFWFEPRFFARRVVPWCDVLVANSSVTARRVEGWLPPGFCTVVSNGIDLAPFDGVDPPSGRSPVVVTMVANLTSRWKRHDVFVEAAARVDRDLDVRFVLAGSDPADDPYARGLHALVEDRGLADRFEFAGFDADVRGVMARTDVLAHPCELESFGRIAVEAMAAGRPVVGVAGGGIGDIVDPGVTGLLAPPGDATALAAAIEDLVRDPERRMAMGRAGRRRAEEHFSLEAVVAGVLGAYRRAIERHASA
jgi:glycosyltransferase involved in cell wall biosynthesis